MSPSRLPPVPRSTSRPRAYVATEADIDRDVVLEIVASAETTVEMIWWRNDGAPEPGWTATRLGVLQRVWPDVAVDLDGDGDTDMVVGSSHQGSNQLCWLRSERIGSRVHAGTRRFTP